ncbi:protein of unknown function DUF3343 [Gottschalkia purinilytica]|uniref:Putative Se/S carrier protein-like domain-containing protein n=1 Tax=Gottschalkia purinilytica TaxID=1503 RepID=A0A0L0W7D3_GOTPU|nr:DUF3343 domain-containing protein [Gottschalkia purinilytica]KNF07195.1 protein of unknown function DUF3343 [Gottschalkia purinilytica]
MEESYCIVTFHITQHSLIFEKILKDKGLEVQLMPVPRQISSSCGISAKVSCNKKAKILQLCKDEDIHIDSFHRVENQKRNNWFLKYLKK